MKADFSTVIMINYEYGISVEEVSELTNIPIEVVKGLWKYFDKTECALTRDIIVFHRIKNELLKQMKEDKSIKSVFDCDFIKILEDYGYSTKEISSVANKVDKDNYNIQKKNITEQIEILVKSGYNAIVIRDLLKVKLDYIEAVRRLVPWDSERPKKISQDKTVHSLEEFGEFVILRNEGLGKGAILKRLKISSAPYESYDAFYVPFVKNRGIELLGEIPTENEKEKGEKEEVDNKDKFLLQPNHTPSERKAVLKELYEKGLDYEDIVAKTGLTVSQVMSYCTKLSKTPSAEKRKNVKENKRIEDCLVCYKYRKNGMTVNDIGKMLGISPATVSKRISTLHTIMTMEGITEALKILDGKE